LEATVLLEATALWKLLLGVLPPTTKTLQTELGATSGDLQINDNGTTNPFWGTLRFQIMKKKFEKLLPRP
jgi:hypothetical protein